jgi:hypothetical protein
MVLVSLRIRLTKVRGVCVYSKSNCNCCLHGRRRHRRSMLTIEFVSITARVPSITLKTKVFYMITSLSRLTPYCGLRSRPTGTLSSPSSTLLELFLQSSCVVHAYIKRANARTAVCKFDLQCEYCWKMACCKPHAHTTAVNVPNRHSRYEASTWLPARSIVRLSCELMSKPAKRTRAGNLDQSSTQPTRSLS